MLFDLLWLLDAARVGYPDCGYTLRGQTMKKPGIPVTVIGLCAVAILGLVTQYLAAQHAFSLIGRTAMYSYVAALLIESAIVVDAVVFSKTRNLIAGVSLLVALLVSGVYNYTLADLSSADIALGQKLALAIGPLIALTTIALALGEELYKYDRAVQEWSDAVEAERVDAQIIAKRAEDSQARTIVEQARAKQHAVDDHELWQRTMEEKRVAAQQHSDELARRRAERWARKLAQPEPVAEPVVVQHSDNGTGLDELIQLSPGALENRRAFRDALALHEHLAGTITPKALAERTGQTERTARRWVSDTRKPR